MYANASQETTYRAHQTNAAITSVASHLMVLLNTAGLEYPRNEWFWRLVQPPHFQANDAAAYYQRKYRLCE